MRIPHAIFTSLRGEQLDGYQLAARCEEISDEVARELIAWGPAHDSLQDKQEGAASVNFHPLASGDYCLSHTSRSGAEYSGRAGGRVYTQMFVLPKEALLRFGGNPFFVLRAIQAAGRLVVQEEVPSRLRSFLLIGRGPESDKSFLESLLAEVSGESLSELATSVQTNLSVGVATPISPQRLFSGLLQLLPMDERLRLSFTTGLRYSQRRPFRLFVLSRDASESKHLQRQTGVPVVEIASCVAAA